MSEDIVDRLRGWREHPYYLPDLTAEDPEDLMSEAAQKIEALRQRVLDLKRPPRGISGQVVTIADGCPTYGDLLDAYYRTESEYADHFSKLWGRVKEQDAEIDALREVLSGLVKRVSGDEEGPYFVMRALPMEPSIEQAAVVRRTIGGGS